MSEMFSKMMITFVAVAAASILLLFVTLPTIGLSTNSTPHIGSNDTSGANASSTASTNETTTSGLNNTNNTVMPNESDWENLTTFELFEKYPALENSTSTASNVTSAAAVNETGATQQLPSPELTQNNTSQQIKTRPAATANATLSNATRQNATTTTTTAMPPDLLDRLQSTISSINQSIAELRKNVTTTNVTTVSINQVVVNEAASRTNISSSQDNDSRVMNQANPVFTISREITGDLDKGDYIVLAHLAPYSTTKGHAEVELKVPCNNDEESKVKLMVGHIPKLKELDLGKAIEKADVRGSDDEIKLSKDGDYCLYHVKLPGGTSDIILVNDSGRKLKFDEGRFYVAMTIGLNSAKE
jgi:hypothetical protein